MHLPKEIVALQIKLLIIQIPLNLNINFEPLPSSFLQIIQQSFFESISKCFSGYIFTKFKKKAVTQKLRTAIN